MEKTRYLEARKKVSVSELEATREGILCCFNENEQHKLVVSAFDEETKALLKSKVVPLLDAEWYVVEDMEINKEMRSLRSSGADSMQGGLTSVEDTLKLMDGLTNGDISQSDPALNRIKYGSELILALKWFASSDAPEKEPAAAAKAILICGFIGAEMSKRESFSSKAGRFLHLKR